jgi:hypothetical protein
MIPAVKNLLKEIERRSSDIEDDKIVEIIDKVITDIKKLNKRVQHLNDVIIICCDISGSRIVNVRIQRDIKKIAENSTGLISDLRSAKLGDHKSAIKFENSAVADRIEQELNQLSTSIVGLWSQWKNQEFGSLAIFKQAFGQVKDLQKISSKIDRIRLQLRQFENPPSNQEDGEKVKNLIFDKNGVQDMLVEAGVSQKISDFMISSSNENGSKLEIFDDDIKTWLSRYGILNRFKVVIDK